ncbi:MAG: riboflavin synthase [Candidatus Omnitrophica bacterium]|nr:riboflavin synthase [Candidatus Omnitrophota bacterium]MBU4488595.1 riboflavin synthase [Candidatus Omnitrophota bacterium]MCG2704475.1 riboflavin synthase [Candidatus Omnitrophota bacterium]
MFSGIVEERALVERVARNMSGVKLYLKAGHLSPGTKVGDSIAVNGACLTVASIDRNILQFDIMAETLRATTLSDIKDRDIVNAERSLKVGGRISGHFVTGHIDCVGVISAVKKETNNYKVEIRIPEDKMRYIAPKGSVSVDGVSLTVAEITQRSFKVALIPLTLKETSLGSKKSGDKVNIECDILAKYAHAGAGRASGDIDAEFLKKHGFF